MTITFGEGPYDHLNLGDVSVSARQIKLIGWDGRCAGEVLVAEPVPDVLLWKERKFTRRTDFPNANIYFEACSLRRVSRNYVIARQWPKTWGELEAHQRYLSRYARSPEH